MDYYTGLTVDNYIRGLQPYGNKYDALAHM